MSDFKPHTVCVIGGGMSGLITGALLAKNGYKVTVLEKNHIIGGGLQSFRRGRAVFNTGMQALSGYEEDFALPHLFRYLGIPKDAFQLVPTDPQAQEIIWTDSTHCYRLPKTRKAYEEYLISCFPHEANGIHRFLDAIYEIGNTFDYFLLRTIRPHPELAKYGTLTAEQLIRKFISDERLIGLLGYVSMHLGYNLKHLTAISVGMILALYIEGSWRVAGGNSTLAQAIVNVITSHKGQVLNDSEVNYVHIQNEQVEYAQTINGEKYYANQFLCAVAPKLLLSMTNEKIFRLSTQERVSSFTNDSSAILLSIQTKPHSFKCRNNLFFIPAPYIDEQLPTYISMLTPINARQDEWADTIEILMYTHYADFQRWEHSSVGNREVDYEEYKQQLGDKIIAYIAKFYPEIKGAVQNMYIATPLTIRDYYGNPMGAAYAQQGIFIPVRTRIPNLFMTGQAIQYQGFFGMATTSIVTVEQILNKIIVEEIAKA